MPLEALRTITLSDELFQGHISLERSRAGVKPWRIPHDHIDLFPPNGVGGRAEQPAGVRLRFSSTTDTVLLSAELGPCDAGYVPRFDCLVDGVRTHSETSASGSNHVHFGALSPEEKLIEIFLPQSCTVTVNSLQIGQGASFATPSDSRKRWVTYGSSITQCKAAASPSQTWPALVAQAQGYHLTCLGYGGNCHLEPMVARLIRDLPADVITMCLGINVYGSGSLGARTFKSSVIGLIQIVREKHPETPIGVISPIASPPRETTPNKVDFTLAGMREEIRDAIARLEAHGDRKLVYIDGLDVFNLDDAMTYMPDALHPDAEGYRIMADRINRLAFGNSLLKV